MLYVLGIGSGNKENMTFACYEALQKSDIIIGYDKYINQISKLIIGKETYSTGMKSEIQRCIQAIEYVKQGKIVSVVCSGDSGVYAMSGLIYELADNDIDIKIIPGITASILSASILGAPIMHDSCTISLSDLMTPLELIFQRIELASKADFVISIYNPKSKKRYDYLKKAIDIMLKYKNPNTPVGIVKRAYEHNQETIITTLNNIDYDFVDMHTMIIIGNKSTYVKNGKMITRRGYEKKYKEYFYDTIS